MTAPPEPQRQPQLRISITLSGGAALGAYQAGAMAALLVALQHLLETDADCIWLDAIGGASAGALVALFSAHALLEGIEPVELLHEAWVERVSLDLLRSRASGAPLGFDRLRQGLWQLLAPEGAGTIRRVLGRQARPLGLHIALTGLQGLTYPLSGLRREAAITATTYADWGQFELQPGGVGAALFEPAGASPIDFVLASAAHPGGFGPELLDRRRDAAQYQTHRILNFPDSGHIWYTDGGLIQSNPLGQVLEAARRVDRAAARATDARRVNILIDPHSEDPSGATRWTDPEHRPDWTSAVARALAILPAQVLYDDLRRVEKVNSRLAWTQVLMDALLPHLREEATKALDRVLDRIDSERESLLSPASELPSRVRHPQAAPIEQKLRRALDEIAGLVGKETVEVDVISPRLLASEGEDVLGLLAGEFMGDFGGFTHRDLRHSDFVLGYACARTWLPHALEHADFEPSEREATLAAVDANSPGDWRQVNLGHFDPSDLSWQARWEMSRLALHTARGVST
jgi:predicted acylesterase/phospholipase RssA